MNLMVVLLAVVTVLAFVVEARAKTVEARMAVLFSGIMTYVQVQLIQGVFAAWGK